MNEDTKRKIAVMQSYLDGEEIEFSSGYMDDWEEWKGAEPVWNWEECGSRVKVIPDIIDWSHVHEKYNWMARDDEGDVWLYDTIPGLSGDVWTLQGVDIAKANDFASYRQGSQDWKDSLVKRPKKDKP